MQDIILIGAAILTVISIAIMMSPEKKKKKNYLFRKYRLHRFIGSLTISRNKMELLESYGWYRNIRGGYAHPHGMDYMSFREIHGYTLEQLEYKLQHGSMSKLPEHLLKQQA